MDTKRFISLLLSTQYAFWLITQASSQSQETSPPKTCEGPRTPDELANTLWGSASNYTQTRRTRPNVSKLLSQNPIANPSQAEPEIVKLAIEILSVKALNQIRNEVELILRIDQYWNDYRLKYDIDDNGCYDDNYYESYSVLPEIWKPGAVIKNIVDKLTNLKGSFRIYPNGNVQHRSESLITLSCAFDLKAFPNDSQECSLVMGAWKDVKTKVLYKFYDVPVTVTPKENDLIANTDEWTLVKTQAIDNTSNEENNVTFSMVMQRNSEYYQDFVILPVILMIILGWSSFFIDRSAGKYENTLFN